MKLIRPLAICLVFATAVCQAQIPTLFKDLNTRPNSAADGSSQAAATANLLFFMGTDPVNGSEPWISDGTQAGTRLLKDLNPGPESSNPGDFTVVTAAAGQIVYFRAQTPAIGQELWRTDGTSNGTLPIDINPGTADSFPRNLTTFGATLLFTAQTTTAGREPWISAGAPADTVLLQDIAPGPVSGMSSQSEFVVVPGTARAVFPAFTPTLGQELWRTEGTPATTALVSDLAPNSAFSQPSSLLAMPGLGKVYFSANDGTNPPSLYASDGIAITLVRLFPKVTNLNVGGPSDLARISNTIFVFTASRNQTGRELWSSDGTLNGTFELNDFTFGPASSFREADDSNRIQGAEGRAFFVIDEPNDNPPAGIYVTDGTFNGTKAISDARASFDPRQYTSSAGGRFFFRAENVDAGIELFSSDGTAQGTGVAADLYPGFLASSPKMLTVFKGEVYFFADTETGSALFRISAQGVTQLVASVTLPGTQGSFPSFGNSVVSGNKMFFPAFDGRLGSEPYVTDGTAEGTRLIKDIRPGINGTFFQGLAATTFGATFPMFTPEFGTERWITDGTEAGTKLLKDINPGGASSITGAAESFEVGGKMVFAANDGPRGIELWASDGTQAGTQILKDINLGSRNGVTDNFNTNKYALLDERLYFAANDSGAPLVSNVELWRTDGTSNGTVKVKEIDPGVNASGVPSDFESFPGKGLVLFSAIGPGDGRELWKSDGTEAGTTIVKNIIPGPNNGAFPSEITSVGPMALFKADTPNNLGYELWVTDGTEGGTQLVKDIYPGPQSSNPTDGYAFKNRLLFFADDGVNGRELWTSDGTAIGTTLLKDLNPGPLRSSVRSFTEAGDTLYLVAFLSDTNNFSTRKFFKTDGTTAGTVEVPTPGIETSGELAFFRGRLFMSLSDPQVGTEPFSILLDGCPDDANKTAAGSCGCGIADVDGNGNGTPDCLDNDVCPNDPSKTTPGICGCGTSDADANANGTTDCLEQDACPLDPAKSVAGICGCGVSDTDTNGNGTADCNEDLCPLDPSKTAPGSCGCGTVDSDSNRNGIPDCVSNADFKDQLTKLSASLKRLKKPTSKKSRAAVKVLRAELRAAVANLAAFRVANSAGIAVTGKTGLTKLGLEVEKRVRKAIGLSRTFADDKKKAAGAIKKLLAAL